MIALEGCGWGVRAWKSEKKKKIEEQTNPELELESQTPENHG